MKKPSAPQLPAVRPIAAIFADDDDDGDTVSKHVNMRILHWESAQLRNNSNCKFKLFELKISTFPYEKCKL